MITSAAVRLARLGGALRAQGLPTSLRDELDAADALPFLDDRDREEVRLALRIALKIPRAGWPAFDRLFTLFWTDHEMPDLACDPPRAQRPPTLTWDPNAHRMIAEEETAGGRDEAGQPAWSPAALLRKKSFDAASWSPAEMAEMERTLARLARRLAARPSRRWIPSAARAGRIDPRRSFRRALATAGEVVRFARRERALEQPRLVFLCDTSGSMDTHTRFLLSFALALRRVARRAELFAFNTELVHLTPHVLPGPDKIRLTLERLAGAVPDWSGGTRIGACLAAFAAQHMRRVVDARTTVVILSDGLDRGDPALLAAALEQIHKRARKVVWLNPLSGDPRYQPTARGMLAALPFIDLLAPAHDLESLEKLLPHL